jgi:hypothetical protein
MTAFSITTKPKLLGRTSTPTYRAKETGFEYCVSSVSEIIAFCDLELSNSLVGLPMDWRTPFGLYANGRPAEEFKGGAHQVGFIG